MVILIKVFQSNTVTNLQVTSYLQRGFFDEKNCFTKSRLHKILQLFPHLNQMSSWTSYFLSFAYYFECLYGFQTIMLILFFQKSTAQEQYSQKRSVAFQFVFEVDFSKGHMKLRHFLLDGSLKLVLYTFHRGQQVVFQIPKVTVILFTLYFQSSNNMKMADSKEAKYC